MSDLAASGGYYIAAKAESIVAEPATITGSIGVVAGKLVLRRFHEELLGLNHDPLQRGANAGIFSSTETLTPVQAERFQALVDRTYARFIGHVAAGRGMAPAAVEEVARGRIWSGARALELGLVDELGGLDRALALAAEAAGLEGDPGYEYFPKPRGLAELLIGNQLLRLPPELAEIHHLVARGPRACSSCRPRSKPSAGPSEPAAGGAGRRSPNGLAGCYCPPRGVC